MRLNTSMTAKGNLTGLVKELNTKLGLTESQITFGTPAAISPLTNGKNTQITVWPTASNMGYSGTQTLYYNRIALTTAGKSTLFTYSLLGTVLLMKNNILDQVAARYGLLRSELVLDGTLPLVALTDKTMTVSAVTNSLVHIGSINIVVRQTL